MGTSIKKAAIVGLGNMGGAILNGVVSGGILPAEAIMGADKSDICRMKAEKLGVRAVPDAGEAVSDADLVILAVKPQSLEALMSGIGEVKKSAVIVSILAGKKISTLEGFFGSDAKIVRVMPNTPALVGVGMSGICRNQNVSDEEMSKVVEIFSSFGKAAVVDESLMDIVTGISGSGPAYVYMFIDALIKAGVAGGMDEASAKLFAAQTVKGAAEMVLKSDISPEQLKINVCSPGGTTIEAVKVLEEQGFENIVVKAVEACEEKSKLMAQSV
ncbi:MAG: pyrroline-5-carboxylate reductase [Oscillospiraceae bacterium]|nr:pyrroline-5-carboxylate reductase [Oscillospiraceae bacterium]